MSAEQIAASYAHWWREAGLDCATDEAPRRWRDGDAVPFWRQNREETAREQQAAPAQIRPQAPPPQAARQIAPAVARPATTVRTPPTLPSFLEWLARDHGQPETDWHGPLIMPPLIDAPRLLLLVDMPSASAQNHDDLLEAGQRRFVTSMLAALGVKAEDAPCVSLAMRTAPGGHLDDATVAVLGRRMKHYLDLVRPGAIILLGDRTSRAVLGEAWRPGAAALERIDLTGGTVDIVPLAGLDLLMNRPAAKMKSWQTLRALHGKLK